jgi:hypothetical protein
MHRLPALLLLVLMVLVVRYIYLSRHMLQAHQCSRVAANVVASRPAQQQQQAAMRNIYRASIITISSSSKGWRYSILKGPLQHPTHQAATTSSSSGSKGV